MVINLTNIDLINIFNEKRINLKKKMYIFHIIVIFYQFTEITELSRRRFRNSYKTAQGKLNMKLRQTYCTCICVCFNIPKTCRNCNSIIKIKIRKDCHNKAYSEKIVD